MCLMIKLREKFSLLGAVVLPGACLEETFHIASSLGRYVFGSEISYNKAPPRLPGLAC